MINKQPHSNTSRNGLVSVLYRLDDQPLIKFDIANLSKIKETLSFHQYYCPFNTSIPLCEFDSTDQIINHLDAKVGADLGQDEVLVSPPRRIKAQDILLTTYRNPSRRTCFFLTPKLSKKEVKEINSGLQKTEGIQLFPRLIAGRFHALTIAGDLDGYEIIPDLIDTNYRPDY